MTEERVRGYTLVLFVFELACFAFCVAGTHGWIVPLAEPTSSDFVSFYAAGRLADAGTPALAYDHAAHYASEQQATEPGIAYNFFYYPPVFLLLCAILARLPYLVAFVVLQLGGLLPCLAVVRRIVGQMPIYTPLAFPAVFWAVGTGQNALLSAALIGSALLVIDRRPGLAGLLLGLMCYKPHLALLIPVALVAGRHWRTMAAAALSMSSVVAASVLAFGWGSWRAFFVATAGAGDVYGTTSIDLPGLTSAFGLTLALGGGPAAAMALQSVVTIGAVLAVAWVWACRPGRAVRAAVLLAAIPVAAPVVMFYDLVLAGLARAWLVRDGREHGFPAWQRTGLAVSFLLPLLSGNTGFSSQIAIPPAAAALTLALALRQAARDKASSPRFLTATQPGIGLILSP